VTLLGDARASLDEHRELAERLDRAFARVGESGTWTDWSEVRELHRRARQLLDEGVVARLRALERVGDAIGRIEELGPVSELVDRAAQHAAEAAGLERVLLSRVEDGALVAEALHVDGDPDAAQAACIGRAEVMGRIMLTELVRRRVLAPPTASSQEPSITF